MRYSVEEEKGLPGAIGEDGIEIVLAEGIKEWEIRSEERKRKNS